MKRWFGTDGIRGRFGREPITPEFMTRLGRAVAAHCVAGGCGVPPRVVVGRDTRRSGSELEPALAAGLSAGGAAVSLLGVLPTPAIAWYSGEVGAALGIAITASHNPAGDNGIKLMLPGGGKLDDGCQVAIEAAIATPPPASGAPETAAWARCDDAAARYIAHCLALSPAAPSLAALKIAVDGANGACFAVAPAVLGALGADLVTLHTTPDGDNINAGCGSTSPESLRQAVLDHGCDLGIAFDGDGDRLLLVDHQGTVLDGDDLLFILAGDRQRRGILGGGVVATIMSNYGLEQALTEHGIEFVRTPVGDHYVREALVARGWLLGGEASGHLFCLDRAPTGDALIAALEILAIVSAGGRPLAEVRRGWQRYPQKMINVPLAARLRRDPLDLPQVRGLVTAAQAELNGLGRIILRPSGTEPVLRITVEGTDRRIVDALATRLATEVPACLSQGSADG